MTFASEKNEARMKLQPILDDIQNGLNILQQKVNIIRTLDRLCDEHKIKRIYVGGSVRILKSSLLEYKGLVLQQDCKSEMSEIERLYQKYL